MTRKHRRSFRRAAQRPGFYDRLRINRNWLGFWFMVPAGLILILFLAYPLGKGVWLSFTDAKIGRAGQFIGLENYEWLGLPWWKDSDNVFWLSVFNTAPLHGGRVRA